MVVKNFQQTKSRTNFLERIKRKISSIFVEAKEKIIDKMGAKYTFFRQNIQTNRHDI